MRCIDARRCAHWLSYGRIGLGLTALVAPRLPAAPWVGKAECARPSVMLLARGLGGRDIALGLGPVLAFRHQAPARGWIEAGGLADAADLVGTLVAWKSLPHRTRLLMLAVITSSLVTSKMIATTLD